jgi:hypothetical protein
MYKTYNELSFEEIRRLYMNDEEWERTSNSWKSLIPHKNFNKFDVTDETPRRHYERLVKRFNIPLEVIEQWIYPLYYNRNSTNNYGWLDFDSIVFIKKNLPFDVLLSVNVISDYKRHVDEGSRFKAYEGMPCTDRDREHWKRESTWRIPPIVLDVRSVDISQIPPHAEIHGNYQLVEGHSRLGYLMAAKNCGVLTKNEHLVYIMKQK